MFVDYALALRVACRPLFPLVTACPRMLLLHGWLAACVLAWHGRGAHLRAHSVHTCANCTDKPHTLQAPAQPGAGQGTGSSVSPQRPPPQPADGQPGGRRVAPAKAASPPRQPPPRQAEGPARPLPAVQTTELPAAPATGTGRSASGSKGHGGRPQAPPSPGPSAPVTPSAVGVSGEWDPNAPGSAFRSAPVSPAQAGPRSLPLGGSGSSRSNSHSSQQAARQQSPSRLARASAQGSPGPSPVQPGDARQPASPAAGRGLQLKPMARGSPATSPGPGSPHLEPVSPLPPLRLPAAPTLFPLGPEGGSRKLRTQPLLLTAAPAGASALLPPGASPHKHQQRPTPGQRSTQDASPSYTIGTGSMQDGTNASTPSTAGRARAEGLAADQLRGAAGQAFPAAAAPKAGPQQPASKSELRQDSRAVASEGSADGGASPVGPDHQPKQRGRAARCCWTLGSWAGMVVYGEQESSAQRYCVCGVGCVGGGGGGRPGGRGVGRGLRISCRGQVYVLDPCTCTTSSAAGHMQMRLHARIAGLHLAAPIHTSAGLPRRGSPTASFGACEPTTASALHIRACPGHPHTPFLCCTMCLCAARTVLIGWPFELLYKHVLAPLGARYDGWRDEHPQGHKV